MSEEKKPDVFATFVQQNMKEKAEATKEYSEIDAVQLFDQLLVDAMVTREPARKAIAESDYTSTKVRQRVGIAMQQRGINPEALAKALDSADAKRRRG